VHRHLSAFVEADCAQGLSARIACGGINAGAASCALPEASRMVLAVQSASRDRGHEFQALFHWHVAELGMEHVYIKPRTPQLNGKVERFHRTDKDEFYLLLTYRDDVDLEEKLAVWERFDNFDRPHGAHGSKTPYEALPEKLS
jgi:transposase InsO family protein